MIKSKFELKCEMAATILNGIIANGGAYKNYSMDQCVECSVEIAEQIYQEVKKKRAKSEHE